MTVAIIDARTGNLADVMTADDVVAALLPIQTAIEELTSTATPAPVYGIGQESFPFAASATTILQDTTGAIGDRLDVLTLTPTSLSVGSLVIKDGTVTKLTIPAQTLPSLLPIQLLLNWTSKVGAWSIVAGTALPGSATGNFA